MIAFGDSGLIHLLDVNPLLHLGDDGQEFRPKYLIVGWCREHLMRFPTDMTKSVWNAETGFEQDTEDQDYNAEVDKRMRSLGYMKGCMSYATQGNGAYAHRLNTTHSCMRQLVTRQFLDPNETYYISFKNVLDFSKELYLDYFEWCAKEVYDNPVDAEDIW